MGYKLKFGDSAIAIPEAAIYACEDVLQFRLLMLLSTDKSLCEADESIIAERLGCSEDELNDTVEALCASGLLEQRKLTVSASDKNLSGEQIAMAVQGDPEFTLLLDECQMICGKIFTPSDISRLITIKSNLGFSNEMITLLFFYYSEKLDSQGKKLSSAYAEKGAYSLYNQGVKTLPELQKYIKQTEERNSFDYKMRSLFGIGDRKFTKKEKGFFEKWHEDWMMPLPLIEYAFDITCDKTGKASLDYMSKILSDWHDSGITTVEAAEKSSAEFKSSDKYKRKFRETDSNGSGDDKESSFNTEEFFEKALKRSYEMMKEKKN